MPLLTESKTRLSSHHGQTTTTGVRRASDGSTMKSETEIEIRNRMAKLYDDYWAARQKLEVAIKIYNEAVDLELEARHAYRTACQGLVP